MAKNELHTLTFFKNNEEDVYILYADSDFTEIEVSMVEKQDIIE